MTRWARGWILLGAAVALVALAGPSAADHAGCPRFERLRYDYVVEFHHGGDLFSTVHVVGFTDFRFCYQMRDRVLEEEVRWESRGGAYELRVMGDGIDDTHLLREGANATGWYARADIHSIQAAGLSDALEPTLLPAEAPPSALRVPAPGRADAADAPNAPLG